ncbi:hypothetical protein GF312_21535 [Candidatus Poribacteria bacterium]|nr:hypothetical protein [Candidatus Poribacteria bacterium]
MAQADFTRISTNIAALNTLNSLRNINSKLGVSQLRLATGKRINQASDDPAGLTIALKMNARNEGLKAAIGNLGDAKNMLAVAESGVQKISDILTEMKAKATSAASETLGTEERDAIKNQLESLATQINDIVDETEWNGSMLLDGTVSKSLQTGAGTNDKTSWVLSQNHSATAEGGLGLGTSSDDITLSITDGSTVGSSFDATYGELNGVSATDSTWLTGLSSGTYEFRVEDKATDATTGKAATTTGDWGDNVDLAGEAPDDELSSGVYRMHIDTSTGAGKGTYTIYDAVTGAQVAKRTTEVDFSGGAASVVNDADDALGFTIDDSTDTAISAGDDLYFEYIESNHAKVVLYEIGTDTDGSETATSMAVDADGSDAADITDATANYFYAEAETTYDTGRGIDVDMGAWADIQTYDADTDESTTRFDLMEAGSVTIALNSASQANDFMTIVDEAITKVTDSLNSVGSLVARLDAKEQAVGVQQVNTEAAYNRIMNADMAYEQVEASKYQILQQTAIAMLSQANLAPQNILSLFR